MRTVSVIQRALLALAVVALGGCSKESQTPPGAERRVPAARPTFPLPAEFSGRLPCADCPGTIWTLQMFPDSVYFLRLSYLDRGPNGNPLDEDEIGRFQLIADGRVLILNGDREGAQRFAFVPPDTLWKLDAEGRPIHSPPNFGLARQPHPARPEPKLTMTGMYSNPGKMGRFRDCLTRRELAVAQEAEATALEKSYNTEKRKAGEWLLVSIEGRIVHLPKPGGGEQDMVVVERFLDAFPGDTCGGHRSKAILVNTFWALTWIGGQTVPKPTKEEIHLMLEPKSGRFRGFGGCNEIGGTYELKGSSLKFGPVISSQMYCPATKAIESAYVNALRSTSTWKILGEKLELYDAQGKVLARFESRYFQ